jgi:gamma-glutamyltranspeptidase
LLRVSRCVEPLSLQLKTGTVYNLPPPTQGLASMLILGIFERLGCTEAESFVYVHGLVESTKQAFLVRNRRIHDTGARAIDWRLMFIGAVAVLGVVSYIVILGDIKRIELPEAGAAGRMS